MYPVIRRLPKDEWERLGPIYAAQGGPLGHSEQNEAIIAEMGAEIVGMWALNLVPHAGPLWVAPGWRGHGIAQNMGKVLDNIAQGLGVEGYFSFPSNPDSVRVMERLGMTFLPWKVYKRGF